MYLKEDEEQLFRAVKSLGVPEAELTHEALKVKETTNATTATTSIFRPQFDLTYGVPQKAPRTQSDWYDLVGKDD